MKRHAPLKRGAPLQRSRRLKKKNAKRIARRFASNYGTRERVIWFHDQRCACEGTHSACSGDTQVSHTKTKAVNGTASDCIPQTAGCHGFIGQHGWLLWEIEVGNALGLCHPFVVVTEGVTRFDRHSAAAHWATQGPDAPGVSS